MSDAKTAQAETNIHLTLLREIGRIAFGEYWRKPMGEALHISERQIIRWNNGDWPVPGTLQDGTYLPARLMDILQKHQKRVDAARAALLAAIPDGGRPGT